MLKPSKISMPLLNRLLDAKPELAFEKDKKFDLEIEALQELIRLNLEHLLNTRSTLMLDAANDHEGWIKNSVLNYGIKDFSHTAFGDHQAQLNLCQNIASAIEIFEPRLKRVTVDLQETDINDRILRLRISAFIDLYPKLEAAVFESELDLSQYKFHFL